MRLVSESSLGLVALHWQVGGVSFFAPGTAYTQLLKPLSLSAPQLLSADDEASVPQRCPVPPSMGPNAPAAVGVERSFLLVLPRHAHKALEYVHSLCNGMAGTGGRSSPVMLLRAREYTKVPPEFSKRLFVASAGSGYSRRKLLLQAAGEGHLVGMQLAAEGCVALLAAHTLAWNEEAGEAATHAPASREVSEHMADVFFENADSGQSMGP